MRHLSPCPLCLQELLKDWTDNLDNARAAILKYAAASSQEADDLALNENRRYLDVFRGFWHAIENAVMRREKRCARPCTGLMEREGSQRLHACCREGGNLSNGME